MLPEYSVEGIACLAGCHDARGAATRTGCRRQASAASAARPTVNRTIGLVSDLLVSRKVTQVIFCAPGATVVELFSDAHLFAYHATLAQAGRLRYGYVVGASDDRQRPIGASRADFVVDMEELAAALQWAAEGEVSG